MNEHRTHDSDSAIDDELEPAAPLIAGRTLMQWAEHARRDDCFERMVPSDLRMIVSHAILTGASAAGMGSQMLDMQQECISLRVRLASVRDTLRAEADEFRKLAGNDGEQSRIVSAATALADLWGEEADRCQAAILKSRRVVPSVEPEAGDAAATVKTVEAARDAGMLSSRLCSNIADATPGVSVER